MQASHLSTLFSWLLGSLGLSKKRTVKPEQQEEPVTLVSFPNLLMIRFYLRDTPTLFSVILSGQDHPPILEMLNRLIRHKHKFDYIHSVTPQFTGWELQESHSTDTFLLLESKTVLTMVKELAFVLPLEYIVHHDPLYIIWEARFPEDPSVPIYFIGRSELQPEIPCFEDLEFTRHFSLRGSQVEQHLAAHQTHAVFCRKWHLKEIAALHSPKPTISILN